MTDDHRRPSRPPPSPERSFLTALAERVDTLGRQDCDSVTASLTGGYTITYTGDGTWIDFPDGRPRYALEWLREEQREQG